MESREAREFEQKILTEAPRLSRQSRFQFRCHPGVSCFNACCADVNIALAPYDVLRLRKRLGLGSQEFLAQHTILPFTKEQKLPVPLLRMKDDEKKSCPFVGPEGCTVYEDRPWPCRMYPLGVASSQTSTRAGQQFYFVVAEDHCQGHSEPKQWSVAQWLDDQGVAPYDAFGELLKELTLHPKLLAGDPLPPKHIELYFMASYELDRFRRFIFESRFLDTYEVAEQTVEKLRHDDEELLRFGLTWLRFALFGDSTAKIKPEVLEAKRELMTSRQ
jgi:Fe-S-cluster containining protein